MYQLAENRWEKGKEMRMCVVNSLQELMNQDKNVVALEADLGSASGFIKIKSTHPNQFIECGISEANMAGVAAGMSLMGYKPFIHSFSPFVTRRIFDQIYMSGAYARNTINIYGSDPGFTAAQNGGTHTTWEDMALMRTIPESIVCDAADAVQLSWIVKEYASRTGIHYVRANRKAVRNVYQEGSEFEIGRGNVLKTGRDVLIISCGQLVSDALDAADILEARGFSTEVIDMFTVKPLDTELILKEVQGKKLLATFENHNVIGGLGSAVAEVIAESDVNVKFRRFGVKERFGQVGTADFLQKEFHLTAQDLADSISENL